MCIGNDGPGLDAVAEQMPGRGEFWRQTTFPPPSIPPSNLTLYSGTLVLVTNSFQNLRQVPKPMNTEQVTRDEALSLAVLRRDLHKF